MWITEIRMKNYRAFAEEVVVKIPEGKHLLVYGENGSGKSSLFRGVRGLLRSSSAMFNEVFEKNVFSGSEDGIVSFITSDEQKYDFSLVDQYSNTGGVSDLLLASKIGSFLDYKRLLPIYQGGGDEEGKNVFDLIVRSVLANQVITDPRTGTDGRLLEIYDEVTGELTTYRRNSARANMAISYLSDLEALLRVVLETVREEANKLLSQYFKNNVSIRFSLDLLGLTNSYGPKVMHERLRIIVEFADIDIPQYGNFLNEARLSSLAICLFLASIKSNPLAAGNIRILYLDDVFIGMDMSNRIPLLKILRDQFLDAGLTSPFQLILSMYDRAWYELSEKWFKHEKIPFKTIEMYARPGAGSNDPDIPILLDRSSDPFEQAVAHFAIGDYTSAAVNLRKAAERKAKNLLSENKHHIHHQDGAKEPRDLSGLMDVLRAEWEKIGLNLELFDNFSRIRQRILNPYAHDDAFSPYFRKEIEEGIAIVRELDSYSKVRLISAENSMTEPLLAKSGPVEQKIYAIDNLELLVKDGVPIEILHSRCRSDGSAKESNNINQAIKVAWMRMNKGDKVDDPKDAYASFFLRNGKSLSEILQT